MRAVQLALILGSVGASSSAEAVDLHLGLSAHYWFVHAGVFALDLSITQAVAPYFSVGGRFGGLIATEPTTAGIPIDVLIHVPLGHSRAYIEAAGGPWIIFEGDVVRAHAGFGFGVSAGSFSFGAEIGYLDPRAMIGARMMFRL
jgi:hypothetical protein